jgi:hypothetical protein
LQKQVPIDPRVNVKQDTPSGDVSHVLEEHISVEELMTHGQKEEAPGMGQVALLAQVFIE